MRVTQNTLERVWVSIRILRGWHGCTLPIEVFGYAEELETTEAKMYQRRIAQYGDVTFRQLQSTTKEESSWKVSSVACDLPRHSARVLTPRAIFCSHALSYEELPNRMSLFCRGPPALLS